MTHRSHPPSCLPQRDNRVKAHQGSDRQGVVVPMLSVCPVHRQSTRWLARTIKPAMSRTLSCLGGPDPRPGSLAASSRRCWRMRCPPTRAAGLNCAWISKRARYGVRVARGYSVGAVRCRGSARLCSGDGWQIATGSPAKPHARVRALDSGRGDLCRGSRCHNISLSPLSRGRTRVGDAGVCRQGSVWYTPRAVAVPLDITSVTWSDVPRGVVLKGLPPATAALSHNSSRFASVP